MLIDLFSKNSVMNVSVKLIDVLGLNGAVYVAELIDQADGAVRNDKLKEGKYIKVDRASIEKRTTVSKQEQTKLDVVLEKVGIVERNQFAGDELFVDIKKIIEIQTSESVGFLDDIKAKTKTVAEKQKAKRDSIKANLKKSIYAEDPSVIKALEDWIDSVYARSGAMTSAVVKEFQRALFDFSKGDRNVELEVMKIAIVQGYRDCEWAINSYERNLRQKPFMSKANSVAAGKGDIDEKTIF